MNLNQSYVLELREFLDDKLSKLDSKLIESALTEDPVGLLRPYSKQDAEVAGLIVSSLAYGRRSAFMPLLRRLLLQLGTSPYQFVMNDGYRADFSWLRYRFNTGIDLNCLLYALQHVLRTYGSLESVFASIDDTADTKSKLEAFVSLLRGMDFSACSSSVEGSSGFTYLLPDPRKGGACKRLNMFLRWMVRSDAIDYGHWSSVNPHDLIVPLDVHIGRAAQALGLTKRVSSTWQCAQDITDSLKQLDSEDPLKYEFLLFSLGAWKEVWRPTLT